jgi:hypothetical protein
MVSAVWPLAQFDDRAAGYLHDLARMPTYCLGTNKTNLRFGLEPPVPGPGPRAPAWRMMGEWRTFSSPAWSSAIPTTTCGTARATAT